MSDNLIPSLRVRVADLDLPRDRQELLRLLNHYAEHPMGSGQPLPELVHATVVAGLQQHPTTVVFMAEVDALAVGIAICFKGFSTFKAKPLLNIHDLVVDGRYRGQGVGGQLIDAASQYARARQWCAVTLEVRADNPARGLYLKKGFQDLTFPVHNGTMLFGKLPLPTEQAGPSS